MTCEYLRCDSTRLRGYLTLLVAPQPFDQPGCNLTNDNSLIAGDFVSFALLEIGELLADAAFY